MVAPCRTLQARQGRYGPCSLTRSVFGLSHTSYRHGACVTLLLLSLTLALALIRRVPHNPVEGGG